MSKFLPQKKKLLEDVYEKASNETPENSFSGILLYLEQILKDEYEGLSYKSFENYYKTIVEKDEDYNIKKPILDNLSQYLGYDTFKEYCSEWKTIEYTIQHTISKIVITIINKPIFTMPEFLTKQSSVGIAVVIVIAFILTGKAVIYDKDKEGKELIGGFNFLMGGVPKNEKNCMYWEESEYKLAYCDDHNPQHELEPVDTIKLKHFKKITRPDTLTIENAMGKVWYNKSNNNVEFFTCYGKHPENGKALWDVTERIIYNYAGPEEE
ncbi:hypothetical protein M2347_001245 [Chryseobacterium sp. H1D6B]|uniref:hypothetical protein n=1 Tax=Chryseobacterium sp. H1D6B TaxID=2940588 RepID=UPI0015CAA8F3|nr:hypothetical protein [Chryseobacterium sp. H1D6B]MDH6251518.1 hypothetical protein [Chryseobacterium sp. H1D6B]